MSGVDAAATLSLKIDTTSANESLTALENRMKGLGASLNSGSAAQPKAISTIGTSAAEAAAQLKTLQAPLAALEGMLSKQGKSELMSGYAQSFGGFSTSLKVVAADTKEKVASVERQLKHLAETTRGLANQQITWGFKIDRTFAGQVTEEARKAFETSVQYDRAWEEAHATHRARILADEIKQGESIVAAYAQRNALIQQLDLERYNAAAAAASRLKSIQESRDKQTYDEEVAKYARRNELIEQLDLERYNAAAAAAARIKSIQESRDKQLFDEEVAKYARRNELIERLDVERYEAAARNAARLQSIQESRDKQTYDASVAAFEKQLSMERKYLLASEEMRLKAALDARKLMDAANEDF